MTGSVNYRIEIKENADFPAYSYIKPMDLCSENFFDLYKLDEIKNEHLKSHVKELIFDTAYGFFQAWHFYTIAEEFEIH